MQQLQTSTPRLASLDIARSAALLGMILFHFRFDLVLFGLLPPEVAESAVFYWHARLVAGAFLFLSGLSLWLAHGRAIRWPAFWRRERILIAAAALVSVASYLALPDAWIFFGILHAIAVFSLLALPLLALPALPVLALGLAILAASHVLPDVLQWNHPSLRWIGLQTLPSSTMDLEPVFPWFGPFLLGLGAARFLVPLLARIPAPGSPLARGLIRALAWPGRHSLAVYLVHQPLLLGLIWSYAQLR